MSSTRRRRVLTLDEIVEAALAILDREGLDAVSMRRLAEHLGVGTMTLYHYVADKDELAEHVSERVMAEVVIPGEVPTHWREALSEIAVRTRDTFLRHPWIFDAFGRQRVATPSVLRHAEQTAAAVEGLDVDAATASAIAGAVDDFVIGHAMREVARRRLSSEGDAPLRLSDEASALIESGAVPRVAELFHRVDWFGPPPDDFARGLEWLLDGIEAMLTASARSG